MKTGNLLLVVALTSVLMGCTCVRAPEVEIHGNPSGQDLKDIRTQLSKLDKKPIVLVEAEGEGGACFTVSTLGQDGRSGNAYIFQRDAAGRLQLHNSGIWFE
jgi:hypothetical protein